MSDFDVLLYQMGRVGSRAVREGLKNAGIDCIHVHYLFEPVEPFHGSLDEDRRYVGNYLNNPYTVISIMRDPIERAVSSWFRRKNVNDLVKLSSKDVVESIIDEQAEEWGLMWFQNQLVPLVNKPLSTILKGIRWQFYSSYNFNDGMGYVFRQENLNYAEAVLSIHFNKEIRIPLYNTTVSRQDTAYEFLRLHRDLRFPERFIKEVYSRKIVEYVYSPLEIESFIYRWTKPGG